MNRYIKAAAIRLPGLRKIYLDKEALRQELAEVEGQRDGFLRERDEAEGKLKELYAYHQRLEEDVRRVYAGHGELEKEINFLKFRMGMLDQLHEEVVQRQWSGDSTWSQYVCRFPFERIEILPRGEVYTCCSIAIKNGFSIGNIFTDSIDQIWNSDNAKKLRYSVSKGNFEYCQEKCIYWKNREQRLYPILERQESSYTDFSQCTLEKGPAHITLSCDETCNLQCKSCRVSKRGLTRDESRKLEAVLFQKIRPLLSNCHQLDLLGSGEVFASAACMALLKSLDAREFPDLQIGIITNGQLFTRERWAELANLRGMPLFFTVSVDAAEKDTYEMLRLGGSWEALCRNMAFLGQLRRDGKIAEFALQFVVQRDNFRQMKDFAALAGRWGADQVNFLGLDNWGTYSQEEYRRLNVFDPANPCRNEAEEILKGVVLDAHGIRVLHNIPDIAI